MKIRMVILCVILYMLNLLFFVPFSYPFDEGDIYYRTAGYGPLTREVTFVRILRPEKYITRINHDDFRDGIGATAITRENNSHMLLYNVDFIAEDNTQNSIRLWYYIFNSREHAENFALDIIGISNGVYVHSVDREEHVDLGDNCWINGRAEADEGYHEIILTRHNVCVHICRKEITHKHSVLNIAQIIDRYLVEHATSDDPGSVKVPQIMSIEILSVETSDDKKRYTVSVNAYDTDSDGLLYRAYNNGYLFYFENIVKFATSEHNVSRILWVMNEHHLVASKEIFN